MFFSALVQVLLSYRIDWLLDVDVVS